VIWGLIAAIVLAIALVRRRRALAPRWRVTGWLVAISLAGLAASLAPPLVVLRKLVGFVVMPATLVWLALAALVARSWREPRWRWPLLAVLAAYSVAGSSWTSYLLLRNLERPYESIEPLDLDHRYDAVLVMGGGASALPQGDEDDAQLGASGDRLRLAAALYADGRTPTLVTSGSSIDGAHDISLLTSSLWRDMGVPEAAILRVPGPRNTVEEVRAYARLAEERGWNRIGLVTSARHLPRALALCRRHGLDVEPLPADFRAERPSLDPLTLLPDGDSFADVESAFWEYVGMAAVRLFGG
jgi:uncharacterized SAM-binding protein YcdF (DUF218 family)